MAYLTKDQYDKRRENAAKRMQVNAEAKSLTTEQHEALEWLCSVRHEIHTSQNSMFHSQSADFTRLWKIIDEEIGARLSEVKLKNNLSWNRMNIPNDYDYNIPEDEGGYGIDDYAEAYEVCMTFLNKVNRDIESFLMEIDKKHGTNYAPTGKQRSY